MDLSILKPATEARPLVLVHPQTGEDLFHDGTPVTVLVKGVDHPEMLAFERKINQRKFDRAGNTGKMRLSADEIDAEHVARVIAAIAGWHGIHMDGAPLEFSIENVRKLVTELPWLRDQVEAFYRDRGNFIVGAKPLTEKK